MSIDQEMRPRYFEGQYLGADDLTSGLVWAMGRDERHLLGAHTWGIATGLQLQEVQPPGGSGVDMYIRPGYAWDGFGRPVVVLMPFKIPPELFQSYAYNPSFPNGQLIAVWLQYDESETLAAQPGFAPCASDDTSSRVIETYRLVAGNYQTNASRRAPVSVAGRSIDASLAFQSFVATDGLLKDASVPFQSLPDQGAKALWLIPLGIVRWQPNPVTGQPGQFAARSDDDLTASRALRTYIGTVAESLLAADDVLRMAHRTLDYTADPYNKKDLVQVEGALRARGDLRLWGTQLDFRDTVGDAEKVPFLIRRSDNPSTGSHNLDVQIGAGATGTTWFGVGPLNSAGTAIDEKFVVLDNGNVGIGTFQPITALQIPERGIQIGVSGTASDNFHIVSDLNPKRGLRVYNGNYGAGRHLLTILPNGSVGVGLTATSPALQLDIQGDFGRANGPVTLNLWGSRVGDTGNGLLFLRSGGNFVAVDKPGDMFGIRTPTPRKPLEVAGDALLTSNANPLLVNSGHTGFSNSALNQAEISNDTGGYHALMIVGNRSAGVSSPGLGRKVQVWDILEVRGDLTVTNVARKPGGGNWTDSSDAALKKNIQPLTQALEKLLRLRGVAFEWKEPASMGGQNGVQAGLVAQDVEPVFPEWVSTDPKGYKELTIRGFEALTVESLRDLQNQIRALQSRVLELEKQVKPTGSASASRKADSATGTGKRQRNGKRT
jgi:hypothetical protein